LKNFLKKSVTFFISADYIYRIIDNKKSLFSHVLSILLHRRLHKTPFCIIIYPEKAGNTSAACIAYSRLENDNHLSTPIWVQRQRLPHLCPLRGITEREINIFRQDIRLQSARLLFA
jgi:hypothetical protein